MYLYLFVWICVYLNIYIALLWILCAFLFVVSNTCLVSFWSVLVEEVDLGHGQLSVLFVRRRWLSNGPWSHRSLTRPGAEGVPVTLNRGRADDVKSAEKIPRRICTIIPPSAVISGHLVVPLFRHGSVEMVEDERLRFMRPSDDLQIFNGRVLWPSTGQRPEVRDRQTSEIWFKKFCLSDHLFWDALNASCP